MMRGVLCMVLVMVTSVLGFDATYKPYAQLLRTYVCQGGVAYDKLKTDKMTLKATDSLFASMTRADYEGLEEQEKIAYLINLYNYATIRVIVNNLPLEKGIRDIKDVWKKPHVPLFGQKVSLDHIEHDLLRKHFDEPRIHFAVVCASRDCPVIVGVPYTGSDLSMQLDEAARQFLGDGKRNVVDEKSRTVRLSRIFDWYGGDFKKKYGGYEKYIRTVLELKGTYAFEFLEYDWSLNKVDLCN